MIDIKLKPTSVGLILFAFILILGPYIEIWALNTLFPKLEIPYTLETWAAMAIVTSMIGSNKWTS